MAKIYLLSIVMAFTTMCATPSPAQNIWPPNEKQNFRYTCFVELYDDIELRAVFDESMLKSICACAADQWEKDYDWETFVEISTAPLEKYVEQRFFEVSYQCAMQTLSKFQI